MAVYRAIMCSNDTKGGETMSSAASRVMQARWPWIEGSHTMRAQAMELLSDADLAFNPGGQNLTLGALCREMGETEQSYLESLKTLKQDFSYRNKEAGLEGSVARLKAWYTALDDEMKGVVASLTDEDLAKTVDRGGYGWTVETQLEVYLQALLIFFGKLVIYLKALDKPLPKEFQDYIG
jgi:DinB superfamily